MFEGVSVPGAAQTKQSQLVFPAKREGIPRVGQGVAKLSLGGWEGSWFGRGRVGDSEQTWRVGLSRRLALGEREVYGAVQRGKEGRPRSQKALMRGCGA